ncbi:hypothetical protein BC835DRAFT_1410196 [Cytidiella melzeri]|nr:hypothetical protein BC835DRAFT_1410196 [Cytidiella melzeri]
MPILARTQESCRDVLPFCNPVPIGPGPALNAASAKSQDLQGIPLPDPSERNPGAALDRYVIETRPELITGILVVIAIAIIGVVLWIRFNENARGRCKKYWAVVVSRFSRKNRGPQLTVSESPTSPGAQSDITVVNSTRIDENAMRMSTDERPTLTRAPNGSQLSVTKTNQLAALPVLLSQP